MSVQFFQAAVLLLSASIPGISSDEQSSAAEAQLQVARQTRQQAFKKSGEEKQAILEASILEYQKIFEQFSDQKETCAEAAFRVGEIERSMGDTAAARGAFEKVLEYEKSAPTFAARALCELAHIARRDQKIEDALATYQNVLDRFPAEEPQAVLALTWIGKVEERRGKPTEARKAWLSIAERYPSQPIPAIRAADLAALSALAADDLETGRKIVADTISRFGEMNRDQAWWSPAVEEALRKMKSASRLAEADGEE
ncbi:MAG: tetratricopeptide repeat protein [Planctomycetota bacterium]